VEKMQESTREKVLDLTELASLSNNKSLYHINYFQKTEKYNMFLD
jgi:hypothetical protein